MTVSYRDLTMTVQLTKDAAERSMTTVPRVLLGVATALPRAVYGLALRAAGRPPSVKTEEFKILDGVSGTLQPGRLTLLLGHPG